MTFHWTNSFENTAGHLEIEENGVRACVCVCVRLHLIVCVSVCTCVLDMGKYGKIMDNAAWPIQILVQHTNSLVCTQIVSL